MRGSAAEIPLAPLKTSDGVCDLQSRHFQVGITKDYNIC